MKIGVDIQSEQLDAALKRAPRVMVRSLESALDRAGHTLAHAARREIEANDSIAFSTLIQTVRSEQPFPLARDVVAGVRYARAVEDGTGGYRGMPPRYPLAQWLRIRFGYSDQEAWQRSFPLARHIARRGTPAKPFMKPAYQQSESRLVQILRDGAIKGLQAIGS